MSFLGGAWVGVRSAAVRDVWQHDRFLRRLTLGALLSLVAYATVRHFIHTSMVDMLVYRAEGAAVAHGDDLYRLRTHGNLPATYPAFAALLFTPFAFLPVGFLRVAVTCANLVLLGWLAAQSCRLAGWPRPERRLHVVVAAVGFGVWLEPVYTTLRYGQINLVIAVLVLADVIRADRNRYAGIGLGIAAGLKVTPWFFIVYLLLTGRFRTAGRAVVSFLATIAVGAAFLPGASWGFWTKYLYQTARVGKEYIVDNQSLRGMVDRMLHTTHAGISVTLLAGAVALLGLGLAVLLVRRPVALRRAQAWSVACCAVTMLLISPISWTHHWVWCVPLLVLLAAEAAEERARLVRLRRWRLVLLATGLAFCANSMWLVPHKGTRDLTVPAWLQVFAAPYPLLGLAVLALAGWRYLRRLRPLRVPGGGLARVPEQQKSSSRISVG